VKMANERFVVPELLFNPSAIGILYSIFLSLGRTPN